MTSSDFSVRDAFRHAVEAARTGRLQQAEEKCREILEKKPGDAGTLLLLDFLARHHGNRELAPEAFNEAAPHKPAQATWYTRLGGILKSRGRLPAAIACYERAVALDPDYAEAHNSLGVALREQGKFDAAIACYERALVANPRLVAACNNIASALALRGRRDLAVQYYQRALSVDPECAEASYNLGNLVRDSGKLDLASALYWRALQTRPDFGEAVAQLVYLSQRVCDWHALGELAPRLDALTAKALARNERTPETPFGSLMRCHAPAQRLQIARAWARNIAPQTSPVQHRFSFEGRDRGKPKIKVGYVSPDFRHHPVARTVCDLFALHNRERFEVVAYSCGKDDGSPYRARVLANCDAFVDIAPLSHLDAAQRIYADGVDVLIDLAGHTADNRMEVFALRPAPIQASYLGFPGTTGADFIEYIIADSNVAPQDHRAYYSEEIVHMPHSFLVSNRSGRTANKSVQRRHCELPEEGFVFCSFSSMHKLEPTMFTLWMDILRQVPGAVLWLPYDNDFARKNLQREAEARGVEKERLVFASKLPYKQHLERLGLAQLGLDTRVYNGGATTIDALAEGVPVITLRGHHFASRMGTSILSAVGLPELVAESLEEYRTHAVRLAREPRALEAARRRLLANRLTEPLFDMARFARNLERAYLQMWELFAAGEKPRQIVVADDA